MKCYNLLIKNVNEFDLYFLDDIGINISKRLVSLCLGWDKIPILVRGTIFHSYAPRVSNR